ncbi:MAG: DEAD/DEAH box helicase [Actinomycetia bacterium]|nr:DEAD/DEAH box helicase [Actinomycetes bacterium]MCP4961735.1 DEAD/DEAH box helicase [Actinomycetes bacterium]
MSPENPTSFDELGLRPELLEAINESGYTTPTPIQAQAIPLMLDDSDMIGQAATGTGKTAAFALPILNRLEGGSESNRPSAIVLAPTRELASQVTDAIRTYGEKMRVRVTALVGGSPIGAQIRALDRGVHVAVGTPGRVVDLMNRGHLDLSGIKTAVLDEGDEMLDLGFAEELDAILDATPQERQTVLFSATMPPRMVALAERHLNHPVEVTIERGEGGGQGNVTHRLHIVHRSDKAATLARLIAVENPTAALVFCRTRDEVDQLVEVLGRRGLRAQALHGGMSQEQRTVSLGRLRSEAAELVVATDVAARGLHIDHLSHVVNFDVPTSPETFVHRIGRVGRAGRSGIAITISTPNQRRLVDRIVDETGIELQPEPVPSAAQLRSARVKRLGAEVNRRIGLDDPLQVELAEMVRSLAEEHDRVDIAAAALAMSLTDNADDRIDIADATRRNTKRDNRDKRDDPSRGERGSRGKPSGPMVTLKVGGGKNLGIRPKDLVGSIAGETGLRGTDIGSIDIKPHFSLVDVPADHADRVISTMNGATIRGKKLTFARDRPRPAGGARSKARSYERSPQGRASQRSKRPRR